MVGTLSHVEATEADHSVRRDILPTKERSTERMRKTPIIEL